MNQLKKYFALLSFALLVLSLPAIASAQWRNDRNNRDDDYYGNNRNNGRNNGNLNSTIKNLRNSAKQFERRLDKELDRSRYNGSNREDRLNEMASNFRNAVESLDGSYDNRGNYGNGSDDVRRVLSLGAQLDRALSRARISGNIQNDWYRVQQDLRELSNAYGYYDNNNNRRDRRNRNSDDDDDGYWNGNRNGNNRNNRGNRTIQIPLPF